MYAKYSLKNIQCFFLLLLSLFAYGEGELKIKLEKIIEIGNSEPIFQRIKAVSEDSNGNIYILDGSACKVYKVSPDGKLLLTFGQRGDGPGDMRRPYNLYALANGKIVVTESQFIVSFFDQSGKFIDRINFQPKLGSLLDIEYVGDNLFYAIKYTSDGQNKEQIIMDSNGKKFHQVLFSSPSNLVQIPIENGVQVFGIPFTELEPYFIFSHYKNHSAIALSRKYEILILNSQGQMVSKIKQNIPMKKLSASEEMYRDSIVKKKEWPPAVKRKILEVMPDSKNYFYNILMSGSYVFAFITPDDISKKERIYPVDVFALDGKYVGNIKMDNMPYLISDQFLYIVEDDGVDTYIIVKYRYRLEK
ncbi:MAG: hypothetical protein NT166_15160 [Candidatus Aminicenantes bacterium]|nr:hypothetical protein [Candidatus Aminicenantes bacterium]